MSGKTKKDIAWCRAHLNAAAHPLISTGHFGSCLLGANQPTSTLNGEPSPEIDADRRPVISPLTSLSATDP